MPDARREPITQPRTSDSRPEADRTPDAYGSLRGELREYLAQHLNAHQLPSAIVVLDDLPRTRQGKIDRRALPAPSAAEFRTVSTVVPPRTPTEAAVVEIWAEVLGLARDMVGAEDDFFALGGDSLQATRVLLLVRTSLGVDLSPQVFFDEPSVAALAAHVDRARRGTAEPRRPVARVPRDLALIVSRQQETLWRNEALTRNIHPNNVHFGLRLSGPVNPAVLAQAAAALERRHEALRTLFVERPEATMPVIAPSEGAARPVAMLDLSDIPTAMQPDALRHISHQDKERPFDLAREAAWRPRIVRLAADDHVVMFTTHYLVCDAWSVDVLLMELSMFFVQAVEGSALQRPALKYQYVDFARWQSEWLSGPDFTSQLGYWRHRLAPPLPQLWPISASDPEFDTPYFSVRGRLPFAMPQEVREAAGRLARRERCTLFSTLLAGLNLVLSTATGQTDVRVGTLAANRGLPDAEHVVGLFANAVCLRTAVDRYPRFRDLVRAVHGTMVEATAHQELPFEVLVPALRAEFGRGSLFQVLLIWAVPPHTLTFPALQTTQYRLETDDSVVLVRSAVDLKFDLVETPSTVTGDVTYNRRRFSVEHVQGLIDALDHCLSIAERDPAVTLAVLQAVLLRRVSALREPAAAGSGG